ncbi:hypothetical protein PENCOP_c017G04385 [Penicillium coprophilum]|uniref:Uncharacterized protein n=1 Tax=Penicillium coprophilum TaxID=36646 RepID=A0A1V6U9J9_9EURO|nr:hypothetical protein PENCOP_c017G04385 [Penicillium coprophilum]
MYIGLRGQWVPDDLLIFNFGARFKQLPHDYQVPVESSKVQRRGSSSTSEDSSKIIESLKLRVRAE